MAEVLAEFAEPIVANGVAYKAQACAAPLDNVWEGWVEFIPIDGGSAVRSSRETTQPNLTGAQYWATGLTPVYLEGALNRALRPLVRRTVVPSQPVFDAPAPDAILDPFSVYEKGESPLRRELGALSAWHLVNIVRAYELSDEPVGALNSLSVPELVERIIAGVRADAGARR